MFKIRVNFILTISTLQVHFFLKSKLLVCDVIKKLLYHKKLVDKNFFFSNYEYNPFLVKRRIPLKNFLIKKEEQLEVNNFCFYYL